MTKSAEMPTPEKVLESLQGPGADKHFETWMADPRTRMLVSMLPKVEPPDLMVTILRAAFQGGLTMGSGAVLAAIAAHLLEKTKPS